MTKILLLNIENNTEINILTICEISDIIKTKNDNYFKKWVSLAHVMRISITRVVHVYNEQKDLILTKFGVNEIVNCKFSLA